MKNLILLTIFLFTASCTSHQVSQRNPILNKVEGTWDTVGKKFCNGSGYIHKIELIENDSKVKFTFFKKSSEFNNEVENIYIYTLIETLNDRIVMQFDDEKRTTESGDLVVWEFIFEPNEQYSWRRTDWPERQKVRPFQARCDFDAK